MANLTILLTCHIRTIGELNHVPSGYTRQTSPESLAGHQHGPWLKPGRDTCGLCGKIRTFRTWAIYEELEWHNMDIIGISLWMDLGLWGLWLSSMDCSFRFISQKGSGTMVCTISREAYLQPAYCKLETINSERSHGWFPNLWAAGRRTKSGIQVMSISYQAKLLLSAMCILVCVSIGFGHYSNCIILFPHHSPNLRYPGMKNMIGTTAA